MSMRTTNTNANACRHTRMSVHMHDARTGTAHSTGCVEKRVAAPLVALVGVHGLADIRHRTKGGPCTQTHATHTHTHTHNTHTQATQQARVIGQLGG